MNISEEEAKRLRSTFEQMAKDRQLWWTYWQTLADYILPRRYRWLTEENNWNKEKNLVNAKIVDGTATQAIKTLASGLMNGITSPARPWFRLSSPLARYSYEAREWFDFVSAEMLQAMAESNFYSSIAIQYIDLAVFQSSSMLIYEDEEDIFRCYNDAIGEFFFAQDNRQVVTRYAREFQWKVLQVVKEFGLENCSDRVQMAFRQGDGRLHENITVCHMIEPNDGTIGEIRLPKYMKYREVYWEKKRGAGENRVLRVRGFHEYPGSHPRWEIVGNDSYGIGPSTDAIGDIRQLQHMQKRKLQALDKMVSPPIVADIQLQHRPTALMPNGITYVAGAGNIGVKPLYTVQLPYNEVMQDITRLQGRIQEAYHNDLFRMISSLETVRSATEIDARREEKLVLLGPVLDRIQRELLAPCLKRIFGIMLRKGYFPPVPEVLRGQIPMIEYSSVLSDAQRAVGAAPLERFAAFVGNLSGAKPELLDIPNWDAVVENYADMLGIPATNINPKKVVAQIRQRRQQQEQAAAGAEAAPGLAQSAKLLSETPVGGAASALDVVLGGGV